MEHILLVLHDVLQMVKPKYLLDFYGVVWAPTFNMHHTAAEAFCGQHFKCNAHY